MLTFPTSTKIKGSKCQKIRNVLEISKSLKQSESGPREGGKLITRIPVSHGQSSCKNVLAQVFIIFINVLNIPYYHWLFFLSLKMVHFIIVSLVIFIMYQMIQNLSILLRLLQVYCSGLYMIYLQCFNLTKIMYRSCNLFEILTFAMIAS